MKPLRLSPRKLAEFLEAARENPITVTRAAELGWKRIDARPWTKLRAVWEHVDGWRLENCGHPTALWPWDLRDPSGLRHLVGALQKDIGAGYAWSSLALAMNYVEAQRRKR